MIDSFSHIPKPKLPLIDSFSHIPFMGAQWLSGRVLDLRPRGRQFEPNRHPCVVSLSKTHLSLLRTDSTQEGQSQDSCKIVDWDVKNQIKQTNIL